MNEELKQAQETLLELSALALKYLINNFHFINEEYVERKSQIANLTEKIKIALNDFYGYKDSQKELIKEHNRLFDLCKEQENELNDLREFAKIMSNIKIVDSNHKIYGINEKDIELIKKVVEKYGKINTKRK